MKNKGKNGVYGIILGCVLAVGIAGLALTANIRRSVEHANEVASADVEELTEKNEPEYVAEEEEDVEVSAVPVQAEAEPEEKEPEYVAPADGKIIASFSREPAYSQTFDDYRSHMAVDIEAEKSSQVRAVSDGKVEKIYTDSLYGITIEINHGDGLVSRYCGLSTAELVKAGDEVKTGDVISGIGESPDAEKELPPHLHFEMILDGKKADPMDYIS